MNTRTEIRQGVFFKDEKTELSTKAKFWCVRVPCNPLSLSLSFAAPSRPKASWVFITYAAGTNFVRRPLQRKSK